MAVVFYSLQVFFMTAEKPADGSVHTRRVLKQVIRDISLASGLFRASLYAFACRVYGYGAPVVLCHICTGTRVRQPVMV